MADVLTPEQRSYNMSRIRGRDTGPERALRKALWAAGYRYRLHSDLPGRPDIVFPGKRIAVFVDGCFWHGCPNHSVKPQTNPEFWRQKISRNVRHDKEVALRLRSEGWTVVRIWEHQVSKNLDAAVETVVRQLRRVG